MEIEKNFSHLYDEDDDILNVYDSDKSPFEFVEISDFISLGLNKDGSFNSLEIADASNFFKSMNINMDKEFLKNLNIAKMKQNIFRGMFFLFLILFSKGGEKIEQSLPPLSRVEYKSPLLKAYEN